VVSRSLDLDYPQLLLIAFAVCVAAALVAVVGTSSATFGTYNARWDGASGLEGEASAVGIDSQLARDTAEYGDVPPNETIAVVLAPEEPYEPEAAGRLGRFVREGGTLLIADDYGSYTDPLLADLGVDIRLDGRTLRDERYYYRSPALPIARNVSEHRYTEDVSQLTLNHGTAIRGVESGAESDSNGTKVLINSSTYAYLDSDGNERLDGNETLAQYPVAVVEPVGAGQVLVVSDPSVLINAMLDRPGNRAFVRTLFGAHERVLIDQSHTAAVPPLALAVLVLRDSPLLQVLLGAGALAVVGVAARRPAVLAGMGSRVARQVGRGERGERERTEGEDGSLGPDAIEAYLRERHPDWEPERIERITREVKNYRSNDRNHD
jgi:hypothetical protein